MELTQENFEKLQADLTAANGEAASRRTALNTLKEEMKQFEGIDPAAYQEAMTAKQKLEEARLRQEGEFEELLAAKTGELSTTVEQLQKNLQEREQKIDTLLIDGGLQAAFEAAGAIKPSDMVKLNREIAGRDEHGVYVKGEDGNPLQKDGKRVSFKSFAAEWLAREENTVYAKAGGGGSGAEGGKKETKGKVISRADFNALSPQEKSQVARDKSMTIGD